LFKKIGVVGLAGFASTVTRDNPGTAARRISRYLLLTSVLMLVGPVMFPPGRARLATNPLPTGSPALAMTMGMVLVARWAAGIAGVAPATMTSTFICTSSSARPGRRS